MATIIQKIKAFISSGEASSAPPLGPLLGQYQVNISEFVPKFNTLSLEKYERGIILAVFIFRNPKDKTYKIVIKGPTIMGLVNSVSKLSINGKECIDLIQLYDIARIKHKILANENVSLKSVTSSTFATISSSKISIQIPEQWQDEESDDE